MINIEKRWNLYLNQNDNGEEFYIGNANSNKIKCFNKIRPVVFIMNWNHMQGDH